LLAQTTETSYRYVGENEQSYTFRVTATDNVGNADTDETSVETLSGVTKYYYRHVAPYRPSLASLRTIAWAARPLGNLDQRLVLPGY
jgi:hypothetical protein